MELSHLAVPSVYALITFLGYPSQWLLLHLEPAPITKNELIFSNMIVLLILLTYTRSVFVDAGTIASDWATALEPRLCGEKQKKKEAANSRKWCRKCAAPKPPRAHHCKACKRCIPKMDHHCPWTANCVSHTTFPHFVRFLVYTTVGLSFLQKLFFTRLYHLWNVRDLPAYLGPRPFLLFHLFVALVVNSITLFAVGILAIRNLWTLAVNVTTIEGWEIERHRTLLRRARHFGGYLETADGSSVRIKKQEFPYDIGIWQNICQGMGTWNPLQWFNPIAPTPTLESGLWFETNDFEDEGTVWPPPDPDRSYKRRERVVDEKAFVYENQDVDGKNAIEAFRARQAEDVVRRRRPFVERLEERIADDDDDDDDDEGYEYGDGVSDDDEKVERWLGDGEGKEGWRNSEGERLQDFGLDEEVEFYDEQEDEIPLAELVARRQAASSVECVV
ncbi:Palmitoyltransferase [Pleosporales sp. CAS-2024a]